MVARYFPKGIHTANQPVYFAPLPVHAPGTAAFITIAQQVGAESFSLPERLTRALNEREPRAASWSHWDKELVEKVSAESHIPTEMVASLNTSGHSWIDDLLNDISGHVDEMMIFSRVKKTVRELASGGRVILIGHGSTYMTHDLPGGLHIRLVAPLKVRLKNVAERFKLTPRDAARHMRHLDRQRQKFFARFWPGRPLNAERFAAVLNIAELDDDRLTNAILAMLPSLKLH